MHGVLKVKTTAEQEAERRKERTEKAKKFQALTKQIFDKRRNGDKDDELMKLTEKLLGANPDFYTMWNIRKELFLSFKETRTEEEMQELFLHELKFLQGCLHVNPKSYGVWEHRRFALENMPKPDWTNDLKLCNQFLAFDSRNFHCWDYRRFVVKNAEISSQEEFDFTTKKISENFSNYSAWHNRSKLLPKVYPDTECKGKVTEDALLKEFELVQNAFFTDPNDQSAWFYQRWLLGREDRELEILHFGVKRIADGMRIILSLSKPISLAKNSKITLCLNDEEVKDITWQPSDDRNSHSLVWIAVMKFDKNVSKFRITVDDIATKECNLLEGQNEAAWHWSYEDYNLMFRDEHTAAKSSVLTNELESCKMLLEEETENKWVMLTVVFLMRSLDADKHLEETDTLLSNLMECDPMRRQYYMDLRSKYRIEDELRRMKRNKDNFDTLDLRNKELTAVYYHEYLTGFKVVKLSGNKLKSLKRVHMLQNAVSIDLDQNEIDNLDGFENLASLEELSLRNNQIRTLEDLKTIGKVPGLKKICLDGNTLCKSTDYSKDFLRKLIPTLDIIDKN